MTSEQWIQEGASKGREISIADVVAENQGQGTVALNSKDLSKSKRGLPFLKQSSKICAFLSQPIPVLYIQSPLWLKTCCENCYTSSQKKKCVCASSLRQCFFVTFQDYTYSVFQKKSVSSAYFLRHSLPSVLLRCDGYTKRLFFSAAKYTFLHASQTEPPLLRDFRLKRFSSLSSPITCTGRP